MALIYVKEYYVKMLNQYIETKEDLKDFEQALKDGYITEEKLQDAIEDVERIKENLDRLGYIMFLLELPKRKKKKDRYLENGSNKLLLNYFKKTHSDAESVEAENINLLTHLRRELKALKNKKDE